ncbi:MAG: hypothetical protein JRF15_13055 [Deltaproteobacteria bacterium]|nr:hypothetical protein [Deltaproteobacteria bacterium]
MTAMRAEDAEFGRFTVLLGALVIYMCALPFLSGTGFGLLALRVGSSLLLLAAVYSVSKRRWQFVLAIALAIPAVGVQLFPPVIGEPGTLMVRLGMSAIVLFYIMVLISIFLLEQSRVSADMVLGAVNIFLLLAIAFMFLHAFVEVVQPGSYLYQGDSLTAVLEGHPEAEALAFLLYFSVVTLTTLGYGDIAPALPAARMLCSLEAVIGQLFVAIFVARMVAIHISHRDR